MNNPLGIYIHIPFCISRCAYCDFYSGADGALVDGYVNAVIDHIRSYGGMGLQGDTVYFGGGTPTLIGADALCRILECVFDTFEISPSAEITAECNPKTASEDAFAQMRKAGFNRLSIGIQSGVDSELSLLGRPHTSYDGAVTVEKAKRAGFDNVSCDIMLGIPNQTFSSLDATLSLISSLDVRHVSAYMLKLEEGTRLYKNKSQYAFPDDDAVCDMASIVTDRLEGCGIHRYEISNYAQDGFESRHNLKYWTRGEYLAFGPSASGFFNGFRYTFAPDINKYISFASGKTELGDALCEQVQISKSDAEAEYLMLGLRLVNGVDKGEYRRLFGCELDGKYSERLAIYIKNGFMESDTHVRFTKKGFDVSNTILSDILEFDV